MILEREVGGTSYGICNHIRSTIYNYQRFICEEKLSPEARARREFFNSHRFYFETDPSTGKVQLKAEKIEK